MPLRDANARWNGHLKDGTGEMSFGSGAYNGAYSFGSRFEEESGTNPEELIAAAHAGCFSMALAGNLGKAGYDPESVQTTAKVHLDKQESGFAITAIDLITEAVVPDIEDEEFQRLADETRTGCPVSQALKAVQINVEAKLTT